MAKNFVVGIILAIILGGIGLAYAGNVKLGITLFAVELIAFILYGVLGFIPVLPFIFLIIGILAWIAAIVLTVKTLKASTA